MVVQEMVALMVLVLCDLADYLAFQYCSNASATEEAFLRVSFEIFVGQ